VLQSYETAAIAKEQSALLGLFHVSPLLPLATKLPEPYRSVWLLMQVSNQRFNVPFSFAVSSPPKLLNQTKVVATLLQPHAHTPTLCRTHQSTQPRIRFHPVQFHSFPFLSVPYTLKGKPVGGDDGAATDKKGKKPSKAKLAMEAAKAKKEQERNAKQQAASSEASEKATGGGGGGSNNSSTSGGGAGGGGAGSANSNAILSEKDLLAEVKTFTEDQV
jgi:uncharacterized membrane protein YgcG